MDAVVGFIVLVTSAVEAVLLCKSRNKQRYHHHRLYFSPRKYLGLENFSKILFQKLWFSGENR